MEQLEEFEKERQRDLELLFQHSRESFIDALQGLKDIWICFGRPNGTPEEQLKSRQLFYRLILIQETYYEILSHYTMEGGREAIQELLRSKRLQAESPDLPYYFNSKEHAREMIDDWLRRSSKELDSRRKGTS